MPTPVALVTAAADGIGGATADAFGRAEHRVVAVDINEAGLAARAAASDAEVETVVADVTDEAASRGAVQAAIDAFGRLDVLVNVVGGSRPGKTVLDLELAE